MAIILPFQGIRPNAAFTERVAALPYDVYNRQEAYIEAAKDRLSFLNIDRPETQFAPDVDMYAPFVYEKARDMLNEQIQKHIYETESHKCFYIYELTMEGRTQTGIVACASIDDYCNNVIKKHENTRADKEADRIAHVDVCSAQTGPIFLSYRKNDQIFSVTERTKQQRAVFDFTSSDGIRHRGWVIDDASDIAAIQNAFAGIQDIYIADGHHRAASAVRVGLRRRAQYPDYTGNEEFNSFLSILFPGEELMIMDYNRVVKDLNGLSEQEFITRLESVCEISKCKPQQKPAIKGDISMYLGSQWYSLRIRDEFRCDDPVDGLDVSILQKEVLDAILGITDPKSDKRIDFVGGIRGMGELERRVKEGCAVAFAMYPTSIDELFAVADANRLMPPKSTWFEPKLRSGLFIHRIES